jgi:hypothetical protein
MIAIPIQKVKPKKATVKFGMELAIESGQLTAAIVKGSGKTNLEITLEPESQSKAEPYRSQKQSHRLRVDLR